MSDQFNNDFYNQNTTNPASAADTVKTATPKHSLSKGAVIFIILAAVCTFAGFSPFFLKKHVSISKKISVNGGGVLYITELRFGYDTEVLNSYNFVSLEGYVLK